MKITISILLIAYLHLSNAFMKIPEFFAKETNLLRCYETNQMGSRRTSSGYTIHGQELPLPNSVETFISLVERYESLQPTAQTRDTIQRLLQSFRIDDLDPDIDERQLWDQSATMHNDIKRAIFGIPETIRYSFSEDDFSDDERCALHLMLSHTINDTRLEGSEGVENKERVAKYPREVGVVSLHSKWTHALALGRVLLGIGAAYLPSKEVRANAIFQALKKPVTDDVNINPVYSVTLGDLVTRLIEFSEINMLPNGMWNDVTCPTEYQLEDNNGAYVSLSEIRGAVDGLIIGKKIQENRDSYTNFKVSQILRMYYGYSGLLDNEKTRWCSRERAFQSMPDLEAEMVNFNRIWKVANSNLPGNKANMKVQAAIQEINNNIFKDIDAPECSISELSADRKMISPSNIFVIMDFSSQTKLRFQYEVIGNLSNDFDIRPRGNLMGVYTNIKPTQQNTLDTIVKNVGTAGCPSCFAKYYSLRSGSEDESEVFKDLNHTLTHFEEDYDDMEDKFQDQKGGSPGKVILYFNFGSPNTENMRFQESFWDFKRYYGGATILAVGENRQSLKTFTENEQTDVFTGSTNAEKTAKDIKERLRKVPGEFAFKNCFQSTPSRETENKKEVFITPNKMQYWAMYPQSFLKSYGIKLKFKAQEGTSVTVCFSRYFSEILDRKAKCETSNGEEIIFYESNPCKKKTVYSCNPFYFSVEAKKQSPLNCESLRCNTPTDISFGFEHEGISCNIASCISISNIALLLAAIIFYLHRH